MSKSRAKSIFAELAVDNVRANLVRSAIELFAKKGYSRTTIRDITDLAGTTQPMIYYYFNSKLDLFRQVLEEIATRNAQVFEAVDDNLPIDKYLRAVLKAAVGLYDQDPNAGMLMTNFVYTPDTHTMFRRAGELLLRPTQVLVESFERRKIRGEIREDIDSLALAFLFLGMFGLLKSIEFATNQQNVKLFLPSSDDAIDHALNIVTNGILK